MLMMPGNDVLTKPEVRRIEVFTGAGRRRRWSPEDKARIVAESYALSVGEVADRYGLNKTQLFTWRREARVLMPAPSEPGPALQPTSPRPKRARRRKRGGDIELEIGGVAVRVERGADAKTVATVIRALKAEP